MVCSRFFRGTASMASISSRKSPLYDRFLINASRFGRCFVPAPRFVRQSLKVYRRSELSNRCKPIKRRLSGPKQKPQRLLTHSTPPLKPKHCRHRHGRSAAQTPPPTDHQEKISIDLLARLPGNLHRDPVQIARILGKRSISFNI